MKMSDALWALAPVSFGELCHPDYRRRFPEWTMMRDLQEGQTAVQDREEIYLPRRTHMTPQDYAFYLSQAEFFNAVAPTKQDWLTRIFRRPISMQTPISIDPDTIARDGRSFRRLARDLTDEVLLVNRVGLLVDLPPFATSNPKPYVVQYPAESIIWWDENATGVTGVLLAENRPANDRRSMFSSKTTIRCRYLGLDENGDYFQLEGTEEFFSTMQTPPLEGRNYVEIRQKRLKYIPFYVFSAQGDKVQPGKPLMLDIGHKNIAHYKATARLNMARHYVASPIYVAKYADSRGTANFPGLDDGEDADALVIASEFVWELGKDDDAKILQMNGNGLETLENALTEIEDQMRVLGARLTGQSKGTAARSAVTDESDKDSNESNLLDVVENVSRGLEAVLKTVADWRGAQGLIRVQLNKQFFAKRLGAREISAIDRALGRSIPPSQVYDLMHENGWIDEDMTLDEFLDELEEYQSMQADKLNDVVRRDSLPAPAKPAVKKTPAPNQDAVQ